MWQLLAIGLGPDAIRYREKVGRLHRIHRGVDAVAIGSSRARAIGWRPSSPTVPMRCSAAGPQPPSGASVRARTRSTSRRRTASAAGRRSSPPSQAPPGRPHCPRRHPGHERARTILDLAAQLAIDPLTNLVEEADRKQLFDLKAIDRAIARRPRAAGVARLRAVLAVYRDRGSADTRSRLERSFRRLIAAAGLPEPQFNVLVAGITVDVWWPQWKLVVELDGEPYHTTPSAFESDRIRDATRRRPTSVSCASPATASTMRPGRCSTTFSRSGARLRKA